MGKRWVIGVSVLAIIVVTIAIGIRTLNSSDASGMLDHLTVAQAVDRTGEVVKVGGDVIPGSIIWDGASRSLRFKLTSEGNQMAVVYWGLAPNDFKPGSALVVEGTYSSNGIFEATSLTTRSSPLCKACHG